MLPLITTLPTKHNVRAGGLGLFFYANHRTPNTIPMMSHKLSFAGGMDSPLPRWLTTPLAEGASSLFIPSVDGSRSADFRELLRQFADFHHAVAAHARYIVRMAEGPDEFIWSAGSPEIAADLEKHVESETGSTPISGKISPFYYLRIPLHQGDDLLGSLLLAYSDADLPDNLPQQLPSSVQHLSLYLLQLHRLAEAETTRSIWVKSVRHQAVLAESLEWLTELEAQVGDEQDRNCLYRGLLSRARILCDAVLGAIALYRDNGTCYQWLAQGLSAEDMDQLLKERGPEMPFSWQVQAFPGIYNVFECPIVTNQGIRARVYLANKTMGEFNHRDEAHVAQLATQVFRTLEKLELMEDLRLSNQFLAMERRDQEKLIRELKDTQQQLLHSEKLASLGQLAAGIAHEINNPVSFVSSNLHYLDSSFRDIAAALDSYQATALAAGQKPCLDAEDWQTLRSELNDIISESREGIERVRQIVLDLKNFSRAGEASWSLTDLHQCIDSTLNIIRNEVKYHAEVIKEYGEIPLIQCASGQINQVIMNLLVNAAQAIAGKGTITIKTGREGEQVYFSIKDTGQGIRPEYLSKIFDPFFTTKPVGKGTGLGLSLSYGIVNKHGGRINVSSEPGKGSTFTVWLPIHQPDEENE